MQPRRAWLLLVTSFVVFTLAAVKALDGKDVSVYRLRNVERPSRHLVPTDFVLVSTLDGSLRLVDRLSGHTYWRLSGGGSRSSLIRSTTHFKSRQQSKRLSPLDDSFGRHLFDDVLFEEDDESDKQEESNNDGWMTSPLKQKMFYIVEPKNGGTLYLYIDGKPLQRVPSTIREIVIKSPFRTDDGTVYLGEKSTQLIAIDPRTGKLLRKFNLKDKDDAEIIVTQEHLPPHTVFLGIDEYKVAIYDREGQKIWDVTYHEYVPNQLDVDVPPSTVPMDIYIAPGADQDITGINLTTGGVLWTFELPSPVVDVFDVFRRHDYTLVLSKQKPPKSLSYGAVGEILKVVDTRPGLVTAYVGIHEGSLFAMSTDHYPLVRGSRWAAVYGGLLPGEKRPLIEAGESHDPSRQGSSNQAGPYPIRIPGVGPECSYPVHCLEGQHVIALPEDQEPVQQLPPGPSLKEQLPTTFYVEGGFFVDGPGKFWKTYLLGVAGIVAWYWTRLVDIYSAHVPHRLERLKRRYTGQRKDKNAKLTPAESGKAQKSALKRNLSTKSNGLPASRKSTPSPPNETGEAALSVKVNATNLTNVTMTTDATTAASKGSTPVVQSPVVHTNTNGLDLQKAKQARPSALDISDIVLGYGSHGTIVYKGQFDGRAVAVKCLLIDFYDVALQEVKLLQESDDHPNVIRYFYKEEVDRFMYIALELCHGSLHHFLQRSLPPHLMRQFDEMDPGHILHQIMSGIQHLHSLKIVHRDIKPQNILLAPSKRQPNKSSPALRVLLSDFGLCKKLDGEQSSFMYTQISPAGTVGWRAPELLAGALAEASDSNASNGTGHSHGTPSQSMGAKATRAVDIFSAGCVFYHVLTNGDHPFGNRFDRESCILKGEYSLAKLESMGEDGVEAMDLIERMISYEPRARPTADTVLVHPFFWSPAKRLAFLQDASDRFEVERRDPPSPLLQRLETNAEKIVGYDWYRRIDRVFVNDLGKYRKYDGKRVRDLLRALRNKKHHWQDLPEPVKQTLGEPPNDYLFYFTARFPHLFLHTYYVIADDPVLRNEGSMRQYF